MKKFAAVLLVVCVVCAAGAAFAQPKRNDMPQRREAPQFQPRNFDYAPCPCRGAERGRNFQPQPRGPRGFQGRENRPMFAPDMPKEIRAKAVELAKLRIDLEEALSSEPMDKAKALEIHAKIQSVENEIEAWRFSRKLERVEAMKKQRELNKKFRPAPKPETQEEAESAE